MALRNDKKKIDTDFFDKCTMYLRASRTGEQEPCPGCNCPSQILANLKTKTVPSNDLMLLLFPLRLPQISRSSAVSRCANSRVSVQGVKSLGGHFACLCREFYEVKKNIIFEKEKGNTFTILIIFIVKSLQKEQNSTNLLL